MEHFPAVNGLLRSAKGKVGACLHLNKDDSTEVGCAADDVNVAPAASVTPVAFQNDVALLFQITGSLFLAPFPFFIVFCHIPKAFYFSG